MDTMTITAKGRKPVTVTSDDLHRVAERLKSGDFGGPFGLTQTRFDCNVVAVKAPARKADGRPVGQATTLTLSVKARPEECGDIIREALFTPDGERREDVKSVTFRKADPNCNVRIHRQGRQLLLEPEQIRLTEASALDGQLLGPEAHFLIELHGLARNYSSGFDAESDWYTPAYQVDFEPRQRMATAGDDTGQTGLDEFVDDDELSRDDD